LKFINTVDAAVCKEESTKTNTLDIDSSNFTLHDDGIVNQFEVTIATAKPRGSQMGIFFNKSVLKTVLTWASVLLITAAPPPP
jgi:hypothetical protein